MEIHMPERPLVGWILREARTVCKNLFKEDAWTAACKGDRVGHATNRSGGRREFAAFNLRFQ